MTEPVEAIVACPECRGRGYVTDDSKVTEAYDRARKMQQAHDQSMEADYRKRLAAWEKIPEPSWWERVVLGRRKPYRPERSGLGVLFMPGFVFATTKCAHCNGTCVVRIRALREDVPTIDRVPKEET